MNKARILKFTDVVAEFVTAILTYDEGIIAFRTILFTMEQIAKRGPYGLTKAELSAEVDRLIAEHVPAKTSQAKGVSQ
jgi:hypothetical protein